MTGPMYVPPIAPTPPVYVATNHLLHLLLTFFTCGFWALIWLPVHLGNENANGRKDKNYQVEVENYRRYQAEMTQYQHDLWVYQQNRQR